MSQQILEQIKTLIQQLDQWNYEYYALNNPSVPDHVYDQAMLELIELEKAYPQYKQANSPTVRVGGFVSSKFEKVVHKYPMLSLANAFDLNDLKKFDQDNKAYNLDLKGYILEPKIDGLSISLIYKNSRLYKAITRGDGVQGEDVTLNVKTIKDIPLYIDDKYKDYEIEVRGEVFMAYEDFKELNDSIDETNKKFANPRNAAAGSLRTLDNSVAASRNLKAFCYYLVNAKELNINTQQESLEFLKANKFKVSELIKHCCSIKEVWEQIEQTTQIRDSLSYMIDGMVLKVNNLSIYDEIGFTSKFPKWAIAYKFPANVVSTQLLDIICDVGRTGRISYVAKLKPILLDGSMVEFATLHNADFIALKDIRIGDYVNLYKAGDVIPYVDSVDLSKRNENSKVYIPITKCPSCGSELVKFDDEVDQRCLNERNCKGIVVNKIVYFTSRPCMNIEGLSEANINKFFETNIISDAADLYTLNEQREVVFAYDFKIRNKSFNNLINAIEQSKHNSVERLITALGIRFVGPNLALKLTKHFKSLEALMEASYEELISIDACGIKAANSILQFFSNKYNQELISKLISANVNTKYIDHFNYDDKIVVVEEYKNKTFVITGTFSINRNEIKAILENYYDAKVTNTVSKKTDYLLAGANGGSKLETAKSLGVKIIETEFWNS
ncbi:DNA ligase [Ureaplasma diversum]|uniref:DNA ligase n=1 Tax=Ureaplasma diversum TaxID=42094 RepID=A0A0C5RB38_9BACT|nr:NAD-dependent DNA ligase LigA [Ureaplasma diversum]AJQ45141.1 DNA ligase [Ureaplasma diversum]